MFDELVKNPKKGHCERSEAILYVHIYLYLLDCFVALLLAMTRFMTFYEVVKV